MYHVRVQILPRSFHCLPAIEIMDEMVAHITHFSDMIHIGEDSSGLWIIAPYVTFFFFFLYRRGIISS